MRACGRYILIIFLLLAGRIAYAQYTGGVNDGYGSGYQCLSSLNGGAGSSITVSAVSGPSTICANGMETFSVSLSSGFATLYNWSVPSGASVVSVMNTLSSSIVSVQFGASAGNISVTVSNQCTSASSTTLAVTAVSCNLTKGGSNDGFGGAYFCGSNLNGGVLGPVTVGSVSGPAVTCANVTETFSVTLSSGISTLYKWSMPSDATIISESNTLSSSVVTILLGTMSGTINVTASNQCGNGTGTGLAISPGTCGPYFGGPNDGYSSSAYCGNDLNGTGATAITLSSITGPGAFCSNGTELYSVNVLTGSATSYTWTGPSGYSVSTLNSTLSQGQANIIFGTTSGNVTVIAGNSCTSVTSTPVAVTVAPCNLDFGGANDGFSSAINCFNDLNGTASGPIVLGPITGPSSFCANNNDGAYNVNLTSGYSHIYTWTGPSGSTVAVLNNTLNNSSANFAFGSSAGTISVTASNGCGSVTSPGFAVTPVSCNLTLGGNNDGFAFAPFCSNSLNGGAVSPLTAGTIIGPTSICTDLGANYIVPITSGAATLYNWSGPGGSSVMSSLNSTTQSIANILFGSGGGTVKVTITNGCSTIIDSLSGISANPCRQAFGGANDGFAMAVSTANIPLPVNWLYFTATPEQKIVELNWATASETNNDRFDIERSNDGAFFTYLSSVKAYGNGNSVQEQQYKTPDNSPLSGVSYYRLKQVDKNGGFTYSVLAQVDFEKHSFVEVFPNPASGQFFVNVSEDHNNATLIVIDALGRKVMSQKIISNDVNAISTSALAPGVYYLSLGEEGSKKLKMVISK